MESKKDDQRFLFMTSKHTIVLCNFLSASSISFWPHELHPLSFLVPPKLKEHSMGQNSVRLFWWWAFWHKSQTSASGEIEIWEKRMVKRNCQANASHSRAVRKSCHCCACVCPSPSQASRQIGSLQEQSAVPSSLMGKKEGKWMAICN